MAQHFGLPPVQTQRRDKLVLVLLLRRQNSRRKDRQTGYGVDNQFTVTVPRNPTKKDLDQLRELAPATLKYGLGGIILELPHHCDYGIEIRGEQEQQQETVRSVGSPGGATRLTLRQPKTHI